MHYAIVESYQSDAPNPVNCIVMYALMITFPTTLSIKQTNIRLDSAGLCRFRLVLQRLAGICG